MRQNETDSHEIRCRRAFRRPKYPRSTTSGWFLPVFAQNQFIFVFYGHFLQRMGELILPSDVYHCQEPWKKHGENKVFRSLGGDTYSRWREGKKSALNRLTFCHRASHWLKSPPLGACEHCVSIGVAVSWGSSFEEPSTVSHVIRRKQRELFPRTVIIHNYKFLSRGGWDFFAARPESPSPFGSFREFWGLPSGGVLGSGRRLTLDLLTLRQNLLTPNISLTPQLPHNSH